MRTVLIVCFLASSLAAQYVPPMNAPAKAQVSPKQYTLTADQTKRLAKAKEMLVESHRTRNHQQFSAAHRFWTNTCDQIRKELNAPDATCDLATLKVRQ